MTYDRGAERLFEAVVAACDPQAGFAARVEAGLRSSLSLLAADPTLARTLAVHAGVGEQVMRRHQYWQERFAALLGAAANVLDSPGPDFREPTLIGGISWLIAQQVLAGEAESLERQLPGLLEFVLVFYLDPDEVAPIAGAARTAG
jgi:hypothetical protein